MLCIALLRNIAQSYFLHGLCRLCLGFEGMTYLGCFVLSLQLLFFCRPISNYGHFNAVWEEASDRTGKSETGDQKLASTALRAWASSLGLTDLWRLTNPSISDYSFFSARHKCCSRIDYIFASPKLFQIFIMYLCFS